MTPKILCAHDLTESSDPALRTALDLARRLGADLNVLFASTPPYPAPTGLWFAVESDFDGLRERIRVAARIELEARVKACTRPGDPAVNLAVEVGEPGDVILDAVKAMSPVLVVLGTHARKGWQHVVLGSVAERVVRNSPVPVVTVGPEVGAPAAPPTPVEAVAAKV